MSGTPADQAGAALVVALLVVAVVVVLAVTLSSDFLLLARRVENELDRDEAHAQLRDAESLARALLLQDIDAEQDSANDLWARPIRLPTDHGWIAAQLVDLQARFNINSLVATPAGASGDDAGRSDERDADAGAGIDDRPDNNGLAGASPSESRFNSRQERLIRLLQALPLRRPLMVDEAQALTEAITDWIDADDVPTGSGGAESSWYAQAEPALRPANGPVASPSELMWVRGMTPDIYRALAPLITAWPATGGEFNVNVAITAETAPDPARSQPARILLAMLNAPGDLQPLSAATVDALVQELVLASGFSSVTEATSGVLQPLSVDMSGLTVRSDLFLLEATAEFRGRRYQLQSVLQRDPEKRSVRVVARTEGPW